jgi:hypothetical protein
MFCKDTSLTYLAGLGYNVIRYPDATFAPLKLLGEQNGNFMVLGSLSQLITASTNPLPVITADQPASDVNGQKSSSLKLGVGANILGTLISALGGNLSASVDYTDAQALSFIYQDVLSDSVTALDAGAYLKGGHVDSENLVLKQYVLGNGKLYLITKIVKSDKFTVKYSKDDGVDASVQVPMIQAAVGGSLTVATTSDSSASLTFAGKTPMPFGFQCFQVGVKDGELSLVNTKAGSVIGLAPNEGTNDSLSPVILSDGMLTVGKH